MKTYKIQMMLVSTILVINCSNKETKPFQLASNAFVNGENIPIEYTCDGEDLSPMLGWKYVPNGTKSFAIVCIDPDAPGGDWVHWIAWNIPKSWKIMKSGIDPTSQSKFIQGTNSWGTTGYGGPCPPVGHGPHRYSFVIYALDITLNLEASTQIDEFLKTVKDHYIDKSVLVGTYERK